jgi:hypothetical protein
MARCSHFYFFYLRVLLLGLKWDETSRQITSRKCIAAGIPCFIDGVCFQEQGIISHI